MIYFFNLLFSDKFSILSFKILLTSDVIDLLDKTL